MLQIIFLSLQVGYVLLLEASCTLNINDDPVGIKSIEQAIAEKAWHLGLVKPIISKIKINKKVAIIGSGPAGLACAQQLARKGISSYCL